MEERRSRTYEELLNLPLSDRRLVLPRTTQDTLRALAQQQPATEYERLLEDFDRRASAIT